MTSLEFSKLKFELDGLPIFHKIDVVHFEKVDKQLQNNIIKIGKKEKSKRQRPTFPIQTG